jgi:hypothetical protein
MVAPPFETGATHVTVAEPTLLTAITNVGAPGTVAGTTAFDGDDGTELPLMLAAVTTKVYEVLLVSPLTVHETAPVVVQVEPPGLEVTV